MCFYSACKVDCQWSGTTTATSSGVKDHGPVSRDLLDVKNSRRERQRRPTIFNVIASRRRGFLPLRTASTQRNTKHSTSPSLPFLSALQIMSLQDPMKTPRSIASSSFGSVPSEANQGHPRVLICQYVEQILREILPVPLHSPKLCKSKQQQQGLGVYCSDLLFGAQIS